MYYWKCLIKLLETRKTRKERRHRRTSRDKPHRWPWHSQCPREMVCSSRTRKVLFNFRADRFSPERCHFVPNCTNFIPTDLITLVRRGSEMVKQFHMHPEPGQMSCVYVCECRGMTILVSVVLKQQTKKWLGGFQFTHLSVSSLCWVFCHKTFHDDLYIPWHNVHLEQTKEEKNDPSDIFNLLTLTLSICSHHSRWLLVKKSFPSFISTS